MHAAGGAEPSNPCPAAATISFPDPEAPSLAVRGEGGRPMIRKAGRRAGRSGLLAPGSAFFDWVKRSGLDGRRGDDPGTPAARGGAAGDAAPAVGARRAGRPSPRGRRQHRDRRASSTRRSGRRRCTACSPRSSPRAPAGGSSPPGRPRCSGCGSATTTTWSAGPAAPSRMSTAPSGPPPVRAPADPAGFVVDETEVVFRGLCSSRRTGDHQVAGAAAPAQLRQQPGRGAAAVPPWDPAADGLAHIHVRGRVGSAGR